VHEVLLVPVCIDRGRNYMQLNLSVCALRIIILIVLCYSAMLPADGWAKNIVRGPYLQRATHNSIVLRWRTDEPSASVVRYGRSPSELNEFIKYPIRTIEHEVLLTHLTQDTKYYYAVGTSDQILAGADSDHYFVTAPPIGASRDTRVWVLGDSGTADKGAEQVRDSYLNYPGRSKTDFILMLGDNAYDSGTDEEYQTAVFDMYPMLLRNKVLWSTFGNHDGYSASSHSQSGPYYDIFNLPRFGEAGGLASGTEAYYSFDYANIHFVCLDSYETNRSPSAAMVTWLKYDLANTTQQWIIAYWHHPPYTRGGYDSDRDGRMVEMRQHILPVLEDHGVDLVLSGHSHTYERSFLIDGHYGLSDSLTPSMVIDSGDGREEGDGAYTKPENKPHAGAIYVVAGTSGQVDDGHFNHPVMSVSLAKLGSMIIDVRDNRLDAIFLDKNSSPADHFTIIKKPGR